MKKITFVLLALLLSTNLIANKYKIIETEYKKSNNKTIKQTIEIVPIGNGKAIKRIKTQCVSRI